MGVTLFASKMAGGSDDDDVILASFEAFEMDGKIDADAFRHSLMTFGVKLSALSKDDDVRKYVNIYRRTKKKDGKTYSTAPKIQRLITPTKLQRKRRIKCLKAKKIQKAKTEAAAYQKLLAVRTKEAKERRSESLAKRRARSQSQASDA